MQPKLIFVYGTLKQGYGNNRILEYGDAKFLSKATTKEHYFFCNSGIPFLIDDTSKVANQNKIDVEACRAPVKGEVWLVTSKGTLNRLDALEGHPHGYRRKPILVASSDGEEIEVESYVYQHAVPCHEPNNGEFHEYLR